MMTSSIKKVRSNINNSRQNIFDTYYLGIGESSIKKSELQEVNIEVLIMPAHKFLHVKNMGYRFVFLS